VVSSDVRLFDVYLKSAWLGTVEAVDAQQAAAVARLRFGVHLVDRMRIEPQRRQAPPAASQRPRPQTVSL
jgi:hypothetical protein